MRVTILCGLPGVGKLSIARELSRRHGDRVFHNHLVFDAVEALFPFGTPAFTELRERAWVELLTRAVDERVGDTIFTIARDGSIDALFVQRLARQLAERGADVRCVEIVCDDADLARRVESPDRAAFGKIRSAERLRAMREEGAFPLFALPPDTVTVDTSGMTVAQAAAAVEARLAGAKIGEAAR